MAVRGSQPTVGVTATVLTGVDGDFIPGSTLTVYNTSAVTVYLGDATVTIATGFPLLAGATLANTVLGRQDSLYGIVATGTAVVGVLATEA